MNGMSRRVFLKRASLGAAAVGVASIVPSFLRNSSGQASRVALPTGRVAQSGPLVAHIEDANEGTITLLIGERQVTFRDERIARQLLQATSL